MACTDTTPAVHSPAIDFLSVPGAEKRCDGASFGETDVEEDERRDQGFVARRPDERIWPRYTLEEVSRHCTEDDGWFVFSGSVFDVTVHLKEIKTVKTSTYLAILRVLGRDCTQEMLEIAHSERAMAQMHAFKIGETVVQSLQ